MFNFSLLPSFKCIADRPPNIIAFALVNFGPPKFPTLRKTFKLVNTFSQFIYENNGQKLLKKNMKEHSNHT